MDGRGDEPDVRSPESEVAPRSRARRCGFLRGLIDAGVFHNSSELSARREINVKTGREHYPALKEFVRPEFHSRQRLRPLEPLNLIGEKISFAQIIALRDTAGICELDQIVICCGLNRCSR